MERLEVPRGKRVRSGVAVLLLLVTLKAEGDDGGWWGELRVEDRWRGGCEHSDIKQDS